MSADMKNIRALRRLLTYACHEAKEMQNEKLSDIIRKAIREIDLYSLQWHEDAIILHKTDRREII